MMKDDIHTRTLTLSNSDILGKSIVYVMSRDQRIKDNHALIAAQKEALRRSLPLVVLFNLHTQTNSRSREHYRFMLDGLETLAISLRENNIPFVMRSGDPFKNILEFLLEISAESVYFDFSPLKGPRQLAKKVAKKFQGNTYVTDTHNIIPLWVTSDKQEFAAHTIRRKIHRHLESYLREPDQLQKHPHLILKEPASITQNAISKLVENISPSGIHITFQSGEAAALSHLQDFIRNGLETYAVSRNDASINSLSNLSPYLHFGQLSSLRVALLILDSLDEPPLLLRQARMPTASSTRSRQDGANALFEEMIVRKELSDNFCFYAKSYTTIDGAPSWGIRTLRNHTDDPRDFTYSLEEWENADTHDTVWNATQRQLMRTGKMHGYMRMYWAKKILEWSQSPQDAIRIAIHLNDKYSIDGGDPNGYVGILWSITGLHDRPWIERGVFGQVRYMNSSGLKRKFALDTYLHDWQ